MKENFLKNKSRMISVPYAMLVVGLTILYIANVHRAERNLRKAKDMKASVKEAKSGYQDFQQRFMYSGTQDELLRRLEGSGSGLKENRSVPNKIIIESKS